MNTGKTRYTSGIGRSLLGALALVVLAAFAAPQSALAGTSGGATIFNQVEVSYDSGTETRTTTADISLTVITKAAAPTVAVDKETDTTVAGGTVVYTYTIRSNANGYDTYTLTTPVDAADVDVSNEESNTPSATGFNLWGGIVVGSGSDGNGDYIQLPGGSVSNLAADDSVALTVNGATHKYMVDSISTGNAESNGTPEEYDKVYLSAHATDDSAAPSVDGNVTVGAQVGEYTTFTVTLVAGTPSSAGTDGTHTTNLTFTTTATTDGSTVETYTTSAGDSNETVTTVSAPALIITKESRNVTQSTGFVSDGSTEARPLEYIEYRIVVENTHATASVSNVYITDAIPDYTAVAADQYGTDEEVQIDTYDASAGTTAISYGTTDADGDQAEIVGTDLLVTLGEGAGDAGDAANNGGTLDAGDKVTILFQVQVQ